LNAGFPPGTPSRVGDGESPLTPREWEIATLVTQGLKNRQIAKRLVISERTAESHIENIRNKLGFHSRAEIAAWVTECSVFQVSTDLGGSPGVTSAAVATPAQGRHGRELSGSKRPRAGRRAWLLVPIAVICLLVTVLALSLVRADQKSGARITTFAGTGVQKFSPDGDRATATDLVRPLGLVFHGDYLFLVDGNRVRQVTPAGVIITVAGTGEAGYSGDSGLATAAHLNSPQGLAVDSDGNLYIADTLNHRVRKVDANGIITTFAGTGQPGYAGDHDRAVSALLNSPVGVAVGFANSVYIADTGNDRIREVSPDGIITSVAGGGVAGYAGDGGPATSALLDSPMGLAIDVGGNLYIQTR
jgi:DNA-binding CsgD family transcriptional regulator